MAKIKIISEEKKEESFFDRQERIEWWDQKIINSSRVFVAGAGAIGNEVLKNLALLGFRNFLICDFDTIETSNLSRTILFDENDIGLKKSEVAASRVSELILGNVKNVDWFHGDLVWDVGLGAYTDCDIALSCLDNIEARKSIAWSCRKLGIPFIDAGISELSGHVSVYPVGGGACYMCNLSNAQQKAAGKRYSCDDVKRKYIEEEKVPTVQVTSAIISAIQCQETVKTLMRTQRKKAFKICIDGRILIMDVFELEKNPNCDQMYHQKITYEDIELSSEMTVKEAISKIHNIFGDEAFIDLSGDRYFVKSVNCRRCGNIINIMKPSFKLNESNMYCSEQVNCNSNSIKLTPDSVPVEKVLLSIIDGKDISIIDLTLSQIGIPDNHIITIVEKDDISHSVRMR